MNKVHINLASVDAPAGAHLGDAPSDAALPAQGRPGGAYIYYNRYIYIYIYVFIEREREYIDSM